jgi:hypothetical protein
MQQLLTILAEQIRHRWSILREGGDAGYSTEAVLTIAVLVAAALVVLGIIVAKVLAKAQAIDLGLGS